MLIQYRKQKTETQDGRIARAQGVFSLNYVCSTETLDARQGSLPGLLASQLDLVLKFVYKRCWIAGGGGSDGHVEKDFHASGW